MIVRAVGIVGAGTMGQGIAVACASAGLDVLLSERTPQSAQASMAEIVHGLDLDIGKWRRSEGYVTTRVILPFINEAMFVVLEGVATAEAVDTSMRLGYGMPLGPLALADRMGLDEEMRWMQHLFDELGDLKYRPCPLLRKMVRAGRLGVKAGVGFFEYDDEGRVKAAPPSSPGR